MRDLNKPGLSNVASIILAGGEGSRLKPLTTTRCKPAVTFGGRYRLIDIPISNSLNSQITRIYVISQYLSSGLHRHILETYPNDRLKSGGIELLSSEISKVKNENYQGTADAVRKNLSSFLQSPADFFLILSGDQLYNMDFSELLRFAIEKDADLTIATIPIGPKEAERMGLMKINEKCEITDFVEKPKCIKVLAQFALPEDFLIKNELTHRGEQQYLASMGIYVFKRHALISVLQEKGEDFGKHIIPKQVKKGKTAAYVYHGYWEDIGTISSFYHANLALLNEKSTLNIWDEVNPIFSANNSLPSPYIRNTIVTHSIISRGSSIHAREITQSIIGKRSFIGEGSVVRDSIIMGNQESKSSLLKSSQPTDFLHIGKNCQIRKAIIDENSYIGDNVMLLNRNNIQNYDGDGIYIRDGIIIVTGGVPIPDNFAL
jgi:glucose-1-phosphate adenylyltransferase